MIILKTIEKISSFCIQTSMVLINLLGRAGRFGHDWIYLPHAQNINSSIYIERGSESDFGGILQHEAY